MNKKEKYNLIYDKVAKPIFYLAEMYESSAPFVDNKLVNEKVLDAFSTLKETLRQQLNHIKNVNN